MSEGSGDFEKLKDSPHFKAICILLFKALSCAENDIISPRASGNKSFEDAKKAIEHAALQIMQFFAVADSANPDWEFGDPKANIESANPFTFSAIYRFTYDRQETAATDLASRGDFSALEALTEDRGYLRSKEARQLIVARLRGEKLKPKPSITQARVFHEITEIMMRESCSETMARKIWLEENQGKRAVPSENTLKDQWQKSKDDPLFKVFLALAECFVDAAREKKGLPKIASSYPRGLEKLSQLTEKSNRVED